MKYKLITPVIILATFSLFVYFKDNHSDKNSNTNKDEPISSTDKTSLKADLHKNRTKLEENIKLTQPNKAAEKELKISLIQNIIKTSQNSSESKEKEFNTDINYSIKRVGEGANASDEDIELVKSIFEKHVSYKTYTARAVEILSENVSSEYLISVSKSFENSAIMKLLSERDYYSTDDVSEEYRRHIRGESDLNLSEVKTNLVESYSPQVESYKANHDQMFIGHSALRGTFVDDGYLNDFKMNKQNIFPKYFERNVKKAKMKLSFVFKDYTDDEAKDLHDFLHSDPYRSFLRKASKASGQALDETIKQVRTELLKIKD